MSRSRTEKSRKASWNRKSATGFIKPHRISCRQRLRVYRKYMAHMIEMGVEASLKEMAQEELDGRLGENSAGEASDSGAESL